MAGEASFNMANEILNFFYRGQAITIAANLYLRLLVVASSRSGGGTETNYTGYARLILPRTTSLLTVDANGRLTNSSVLTFPTANSLGNGDLVYFDIVDSASGAFTKRYNGGPISPAKSIVVGKPPKWRIGALEITF